jgi:rhodanese-related sulfurtransferase
MVTRVDLPRLRALLDADAQLVEVLPAADYADQHLPGAINIPLKTLNSTTAAALDPTRPVVVYCSDGRCDMSPRAACRLETLGFADVYDYAAGKVDWLARNLPIEGASADAPTAGGRLRHDAPTAGPNEAVAAIRARVDASPYQFALVLAPDRTLLGQLQDTALAADPDTPAHEVMEPGPSTLSPRRTLANVEFHLRDHHLAYAIITDPEGHLLGTIHRDDLASTRDPNHRAEATPQGRGPAAGDVATSPSSAPPYQAPGGPGLWI